VNSHVVSQNALSMQSYTIIGFWPDSLQRFATIVQASSPDAAEERCIKEHSGVVVCGVLIGAHTCVDPRVLVSSAQG
jgi:hypothetical protein